MKHMLLKLGLATAGLFGVGYAIAATKHGPGKPAATPNGATVAPTGNVIPPASPTPPPTLPAQVAANNAGSPPSNLQNLAQTAADAVKAYGWQNPTAQSDTRDFQSAWMSGGGGDIGDGKGNPDGVWGPGTSAAASSAGVVSPPPAYFVPANQPTDAAGVIDNILGTDLSSVLSGS